MKIEYVWYLCDSPSENDLVLAAELPSDYYSPGSFYLPAKTNGDLAERYIFRVVRNCSKCEFDLVRSQGQQFVVQIPNLDTFVFNARRVTNRYVGRLVSHMSNVHWFALDLVDEHKLETACLEHNFFFAGWGSQEDINARGC